MIFELDVRIARPNGFTLEAKISATAGALGIVGPSGSGKSTLLDAVAGILPGARVVLDGSDLSGLPLEKRGVGYVTQDSLLFPHLSVRSNLLFSPGAQDPTDTARALRIDHLLDRQPRNLSGGERRRVALARAIMARPRILLLDEPFAGLDEVRRREAKALLDQIRARFRVPMLLVSHQADEVVGLTDWAVRLEAGRVQASGPSAGVLRASETAVDNYLTATVIGPGRVRVGDVELSALLPEDAQGTVRLACRAHDILLATEAPRGISARNVFPVRIASITAVGSAHLVELESPPLRVLVTRDALDSLDLKPGGSMMAIIKATSIVHLGPG